MKILYTSVYGDGTGYAKAATDYILAMDSVGLDVVPRRISYNGNNQIHSRILELEQKDQNGCNILIQHNLPCNVVLDGRYSKNILIFAWETDRICSAWVKSCNQMDEIWVVSRHQALACRESGVLKPIKVVPHTSDVNKYLKTYKLEAEYLKFLQNNTNFKFYTVGEFIKRKNFVALLKAFHLEFDPAEPVDLIIKTSKDGASPGDCFYQFSKFCEEIKIGLKLYGNNISPYKQEFIITEKLSENDICALHQNCNCFVQPSYGEAWSQPAYDAVGFCKTPIVSNYSGYLDYINDFNGFKCIGLSEPIFGVTDTMPDIYSGKENWFSCNINHLRELMRMAYGIHKQPHFLQTFKDESLKTIAKFDYSQVGKLMKNLLES